MTPKRTPTKDPREFAFEAFVAVMKKLGCAELACVDLWINDSGAIFRAGVAHGRRSKAK